MPIGKAPLEVFIEDDGPAELKREDKLLIGADAPEEDFGIFEPDKLE